MFKILSVLLALIVSFSAEAGIYTTSAQLVHSAQIGSGSAPTYFTLETYNSLGNCGTVSLVNGTFVAFEIPDYEDNASTVQLSIQYAAQNNRYYNDVELARVQASPRKVTVNDAWKDSQTGYCYVSFISQGQ